MNYLAHLVFSHESDDEVLGAVLADFIKGPRVLEALSPGVRSAVLLHRRVDAFTDRHEVVRRSCARLSPRWGLYSSVCIDMLYDHLLARDWHRYRVEPLPDFAAACYASFKGQLGRMPDDMRGFISRMIQHDLLCSYARRDGIRIALERLSMYLTHRLGRQTHLGPVVDDFYADIDAFASDFEQFWPDLTEHMALSDSP